MIVFKIKVSQLIFIDSPLFVIFGGKAKKKKKRKEEIQFIKANSGSTNQEVLDNL